MEHAPAGGAEADVGDSFRISFRVEEKQVAGLEGWLDARAAGNWSAGVARDFVAAEAVDELDQARAVDAPGAAPAPEVIDAR
jgi:hypothetical protein